MARDADVPSPAGGSLDRESLLRAAPVLLRLALAAGMRATGMTLQVSARLSVRVVRGAASGETPGQLIDEIEEELRRLLRELLAADTGDGDDEHSGASSQPPARTHDVETTAVEVEPVRMPTAPLSASELRELGAELLRRSAELDYDDDSHPAYEQILRELAPDEARILRLLAEQGPQPAVDVRSSGALGVGKSSLVAPGLNMIPAEAGCLHPKRGHRYLTNLHRLGLVWFSREELDDLPRYQVLEAQPEVAEALEDAGRGAKTIRRSINLTPFGVDFARTCLPLAGEPAESPLDPAG